MSLLLEFWPNSNILFAFRIIAFYSCGINEVCKICLVSCDCSFPRGRDWNECYYSYISPLKSETITHLTRLELTTGFDLWVRRGQEQKQEWVSPPNTYRLDFCGPTSNLVVLSSKQNNSGSSTSSMTNLYLLGWLEDGLIILWAVCHTQCVSLWHVLAYLRSAWHISSVCYLKWFCGVHIQFV